MMIELGRNIAHHRFTRTMLESAISKSSLLSLHSSHLPPLAYNSERQQLDEATSASSTHTLFPEDVM